MQNEKVPDWALERAVGLYHHEPVASSDIAVVYKHALARYIAEHEEPPVDELYEALKAVVEMGRYDTREQTELLRSELKDRGFEVRKIELARKEDSHAG